MTVANAPRKGTVDREITATAARIAMVQDDLRTFDAQRFEPGQRLARALNDRPYAATPERGAHLEVVIADSRAAIATINEQERALQREHDDLHVKLNDLHRRRRVLAAIGQALDAPPALPDDPVGLRTELRQQLSALVEQLRAAVVVNERIVALAAALGASVDLGPFPHLRAHVPDSLFMRWIARAIELGVVEPRSE